MLRSVLHYAGVDQLGIAGEGDGFVGVMHHQVAALDPDRDVPSLSQRPLATAATTAAQAPVPQASVSPLPRSHTRMAR